MAGETKRACPCGGGEQDIKKKNGMLVITCGNKKCNASAQAVDEETVRFIWFNRTSRSLRALLAGKAVPAEAVSGVEAGQPTE